MQKMLEKRPLRGRVSLVWEDRLLCLSFPGVRKQSPLEPGHPADEMQRHEALSYFGHLVQLYFTKGGGPHVGLAGERHRASGKCLHPGVLSHSPGTTGLEVSGPQRQVHFCGPHQCIWLWELGARVQNVY